MISKSFSVRRRAAAWAACAAVAGCSPALNWRDVRPEGSDLQALFPCKPSGPTRKVPLAGAEVAMTILACDAAGMTFALTVTDVGDATRVGPALDALAQLAAGNLQATEPAATSALQVPGSTPHAESRRLRLAGHRPDGSAIEAHAVLFSRGTHVYQATVLGTRTPAEAVDTFFGSLRAGG